MCPKGQIKGHFGPKTPITWKTDVTDFQKWLYELIASIKKKKLNAKQDGIKINWTVIFTVKYQISCM